MDKKEYGGYLPLELPTGSEMYKGMDVLPMNSGRYAIIRAIKYGGFSRVHIPLYMCESVCESLKKAGILFSFYHIGEDFLPIDLELYESEVMLSANYFAMNSYETNKGIFEKHGNVIFDNTQAFYAKPLLEAYNVYSCRKFVGVSDGAYLVHEGIGYMASDLCEDVSYNRLEFMLKCIEFGTNTSYDGYQQNEMELENAGERGMSKLTKRILQSADYVAIAKQRAANFDKLHTVLGFYNDLDLSAFQGIPMVYPFLSSKVDRKDLVENKVYVPQWWKWILDKDPNAWEKHLAEHLLPLPVDQRYTDNDMDKIAATVMKNMK